MIRYFKPTSKFSAHSGLITQLAWNEKKNLIGSCSVDKTVKIWGGADFHRIQEYEFSSDVAEIAWVNDETLACLIYRKQLAFININKSEVEMIENTSASTIAVSNDKKTLFLGYDRDTIQLMNLIDYKVISGKLPAELDRGNPMIMAAWSPTDEYIAAIPEFGPLKVLNRKGKLIHEIFTEHLKLTCVDWSPDGNYFLMGDLYGKVHVWDVCKKKIVKSIPFYDYELYRDQHVEQSFVEEFMEMEGKYELINAVKFSPDGKYYAVAWSYVKLYPGFTAINKNDSEVYIMDFNTDKTDLTLWGHTQASAIEWSPDGKMVISGDEAGRIFIWAVAQERIDKARRIKEAQEKRELAERKEKEEKEKLQGIVEARQLEREKWLPYKSNDLVEHGGVVIPKKEKAALEDLEVLLENILRCGEITSLEQLHSDDLDRIDVIVFENHVISISLGSHSGARYKDHSGFPSRRTLRSVPRSIGYLTKLKQLSLWSQDLKTLPKEFSHLADLEELYLSSNNIENFPADLKSLKKLRILELRYNKSDSCTVPENTWIFENLEELNLQRNSLEALPAEMSSLTNLRIIALGQNKFTVFPKSLCLIESLEEISLWSNELEDIPKEIKSLKNLSKFIASSNKFTRIPESLCSLKSLKNLNLNSNQISQFPNCIGQLKDLEELHLSVNKLGNNLGPLSELTGLKRLYLQQNQINELTNLKEGLQSLEYLHVMINNISEIPESIAKISKLRYIDASINRINNISGSISQLKDLEVLNLSKNGLTEFPEVILQLINLRALNISNNRITLLPDEIKNLVNLKILYFYKNPISSLPETIENLKSLESLYIPEEKFQEFPMIVLKLKNLKCFNTYPWKRDKKHLIENAPESLKEWLAQMESTRDHKFEWISSIFCQRCMQIKPRDRDYCPRCRPN